MSKKLIFTGGGSAGHCTPNLALIPAFQKDGYQVAYIGTKNGIEREIISQKDLPYFAISAGKLRRYFSVKNFIDPFKILRGYFQCKKILKREQPNAVSSKGGFVTVPVLITDSQTATAEDHFRSLERQHPFIIVRHDTGHQINHTGHLVCHLILLKSALRKTDMVSITKRYL